MVITASSPVKKCRIDIASDYSTISASGSSSSAVHVASGNSNGQEIDEDLHSRQFAVNGRETTRRLFASNVLISGMHGLGAEIAKNLILAGVKPVTLHDEKVVELWYLSSKS